MSNAMKKNTRSIILEAAIAQFRLKGFDSVTINDICEHSKTTKRTFYNHFPSKESVLVAYYTESPPSKEELLMKMLPMESCAERLWFVYDSMQKKSVELGSDLYRVIVRHSLITRNFLTAPLSGGTEESAAQERFLLDIISLGQERGEFTRAAAPELLLWSYNCAAAGAAINWCAHNGELDESEGLRKLFELVFFDRK